MNASLLIVGIIFAVCVFVGYQRGFIKIIASLLATIATIILVLFLSPHVSQWIQKSTPLKEIVQAKCIEILMPDGEAEDAAAEEELQEVAISKEEQITLIEGAKLPEVFRQMLKENNNNEVYEALGVTTFIEYVGAYIAKIIADVFAFLLVLLVATIAVRIVLGIVGVIGKLPVIGGVNKLAGGVLGIGTGLVIVWILFFVVTLLYNTSIGVMVFEDIAESKILTQLYDSNIIMKYITKF